MHSRDGTTPDPTPILGDFITFCVLYRPILHFRELPTLWTQSFHGFLPIFPFQVQLHIRPINTTSLLLLFGNI